MAAVWSKPGTRRYWKKDKWSGVCVWGVGGGSVRNLNSSCNDCHIQTVKIDKWSWGFFQAVWEEQCQLDNLIVLNCNSYILNLCLKKKYTFLLLYLNCFCPNKKIGTLQRDMHPLQSYILFVHVHIYLCKVKV